MLHRRRYFHSRNLYERERRSRCDGHEKNKRFPDGQAIKMCEHKQMVFGCADCDAWYWKYFDSGKKGTH